MEDAVLLMSNVAIIPARGGSKRIPGKNIKDFLGKPIIAYSIETALASNLFDVVMVSTDDPEIAEIAVKYGAEVPFMRSDVNSDDHAGTAEVITEVLESFGLQDKFFDNACCIYPTTPLLSIEKLEQGYKLFREGNYHSVFPVCEFSYPILRSFNILEDGKLNLAWPENLNKRSQDLPKFYHDAGQFYWIQTSGFLDSKAIFSDNSSALILNELEVQDIDKETDWKLAELKYKVKNNINS